MAGKRIGPPVPAERGSDGETFEKYAGLGSGFVTRRDQTWTGDDGDLDPDQLAEQLVKRDGLRLLLELMAERYNSPIPPADRAMSAMVALQGRSPPRGPKPKDRRPILVEIADEYFDAMYRPNEDGTYLDTIIWMVLVRRGEATPDLDPEAKGNAIKPYRAAFNQQKDQLVALVTGTGAEALDNRDWRLAQILRLAEELGLPPAPGSVGEEAEIRT